MKAKRILTIVQMEFIRIFREPLTLIFTLMLVPMLILVLGLVLGSNYGWDENRSIFEIMVPGLLAYGSLLTIYDVAASVAGGRDLGLQRRINTTPLTSAEYIGSQMISYMIKPLLQLLLGLAVALIVGFRPATTAAGYLLVFAFLVVLTFCSVGLGLITANFAKSASAAGGLAFIFIVPQQIFATMIPSEFMGAESFAWVMPSFYATDGLSLIFDGTPLTDPAIWIRLGVLFAISFVVYVIGIFVYEKNKNK